MNRDPAIESAQYRHIASNLPAKISEMAYFLQMMKDAGKRNFALSLVERMRDYPWDEEEIALEKRSRHEVLFASSAFFNTVQTLEDTVAKLTNVKNLETVLSRCRHSDFVTKVRNAATHDGTPTANLWIDGKIYFFSTHIRYGQGKSPIHIAPPTTDLISCCVEFSYDYCKELLPLLSALQGKIEIIGSPFTVDMFDELLTREDIVSNEVMELLKKQRANLHNAVTELYDPVPVAIEELRKIITSNNSFSY